MKTINARQVALGLTLVAAAALAPASEPSSVDLDFNVFLDGKEIGSHSFMLRDAGGKRLVRSRAKFDVELLFVKVFEYRHQATEVWRDGCLVELDTTTDSNGKELAVSGERSGDGFVLEKPEDSPDLPACVQSFAYWNKDILDANALLNTQTGGYEDVTIERVGATTVEVGDERFDAEKFAIGTRAGEIRLWYGADRGQWLALEAPAKGGRTLRYELSNPQAFAAPTQVAAVSNDIEAGT